MGTSYVAILGFAAIYLLMVGILQTLLGLFRIGSLAKYAPNPVVSGFSNGIALSLIMRQLPYIMGINISGNVMDLCGFLNLTDPADGLVKTYRLTCDDFHELQKNAPNVANKLILNMALNLSPHLRLNTEEIRVLAES